MSKIITSIRGEKVDFDLLQIKNTIAALPQTENVQKRERFINKKRRRGLKRRVDELVQTASLEERNFKAAVAIETAQADAVVSELDEGDDDTLDPIPRTTRRKVK